MNATATRSATVTVASLDANPDTIVHLVHIEHPPTGLSRLGHIEHTAHAAGCPEGVNGTPTRWADNTGDLFCGHTCIDPESIGIHARMGLGKATSVPEIQKRANAAAGKGVRKIKNPATEKQMDFIGSLLATLGMEDENPAVLLYPSQNAMADRNDQLTKGEASELIEMLLRRVNAGEAVDTLDAEPAPLEEVAGWLNGLAAKLTPEDLDQLDEATAFAYEATAREWAKTQTGSTFDYLAGVAAKAAAGKWEQRFTKGTLNCLRAAARRGDVALPITVTTAAAVVPAGPVPLSRMSYDDVEALSGIHVVDGTWYKVQHNRAHTGHYVKEHGRYGWDYRKGMLGKLTAETRLSAELAKEWGDLYGTCCHCGLELTDEISIERGMGPICVKKYEF